MIIENFIIKNNDCHNIGVTGHDLIAQIKLFCQPQKYGLDTVLIVEGDKFGGRLVNALFDPSSLPRELRAWDIICSEGDK